MTASLCVSPVTHPAQLFANNMAFCPCHGICITVWCFPSLCLFFIHLSCSYSHLSRSLWLLFFSSFFSPLAFCLSRVNSRLALDDAIRHRQLNISRFSPRVAGENDFLQTVINKVIVAKEVNHKGQGKGH